MNERRALLLLLGLFLAVLFLELPHSWLFDPDEARYAEIPHEMLVTGDFVTPRLNGSHYLEKPPLLYWANAASLKLLGETPYAARLPTRLAAVGTVIALATSLGGAGLWAALLYISGILPFALGRINITDGLLSFFMTAALLALRSLIRRRDAGQPTPMVEITAGVSLALATLTKGLIGFVLPGLVILAWGGLLRRWRVYRQILVSWIPVVFVLVAAPWFLLMERANPGFSRFFFIHEHFQRYATRVSDRPGPLYYFLGVFVGGFLPWTWLFGRPFVESLRDWRRDSGTGDDSLYFGLWLVVTIAFFSLSHSKLIPYILPAFPAAAALFGLWIARRPDETAGPWKIHAGVMTLLAVVGAVAGWHSSLVGELHLRFAVLLLAVLVAGGAWAAVAFSRRGWRFAVMAQAAVWMSICLVLVCAIPRLAMAYSDHDLAETALAMDADEVVNVLSYSQSFPWVLKHPIPVVNFQGELASDGKKDPRLFWDEKTFWSRWNSREHMVVGVRPENLDVFWPDDKKPTILARSRHMAIVANFEPAK